MTSTNVSIAGLLCACLALAACVKEEADDYCRNHYQFHEQHRAETGTLVVVVSDDGLLTATLEQQKSIFENDEGQLALFVKTVSNPDSVYMAGTAGQCAHAEPVVLERAGAVVAEYESKCVADANLKQVNVVLFDTVPEIDELEVTITTSATSKHFAISRQCEAAIFRLQHR